MEIPIINIAFLWQNLRSKVSPVAVQTAVSGTGSTAALQAGCFSLRCSDGMDGP